MTFRKEWCEGIIGVDGDGLEMVMAIVSSQGHVVDGDWNNNDIHDDGDNSYDDVVEDACDIVGDVDDDEDFWRRVGGEDKEAWWR